jgi:hypothetical protein
MNLIYLFNFYYQISEDDLPPPYDKSLSSRSLISRGDSQSFEDEFSDTSSLVSEDSETISNYSQSTGTQKSEFFEDAKSLILDSLVER